MMSEDCGNGRQSRESRGHVLDNRLLRLLEVEQVTDKSSQG